MMHFKVVEEASGQLIALHVGELSIGKQGKRRATLKVAKGVSPELELLIVLGIAARREIKRRS